MKHVSIFILALLCVIADSLEAEAPTITIAGSRVPNAKYETDAAQTLVESYMLLPNDHARRVKTFSNLFQLRNPVDGGWRVAEGCSVIHVPKDYNYVNLNVVRGNTSSVITIYN
ncbi:hypothetical protein JTB14_002493 [Gonioctena quinquepunctata]|nr:hypothetical protein JTB14_002493 [Gonioctena quinquepunctata]